MQLYRSLWVENPENKALVLNNEINAMTCPKCKFHQRLEFPFLCTNVKRGFALWYEPYPDPQIDKDVADYRKHMGPDSFYAKAPRISDWEAFKRKLLEMEASAPQQAAPVNVSPEMQKKMAGFVTYLEQRNKQKKQGEAIKKFFGKLLGKFQKSREVTESLDALTSLRPKFESDGIYDSLAANKIFTEVRSIIVREKENTVHSISVDKWNPSDLALLLISKSSGNALSCGQYHIYRGTLSGEGQGYRKVFRKSIEELVKSGFITEEEAKADFEQIQENIKGVG